MYNTMLLLKAAKEKRNISLMTIREAAELSGLNIVDITKAIEKGQLHRLGGMVSYSDLVIYCNSQGISLLDERTKKKDKREKCIPVIKPGYEIR